MFVKNYLFVFIFIMALSGCATYGIITPIESAEQRMDYRDGRETTTSSKTHTVAIALESATLQSGHRANFIIAVKNGSNEEIILSTDNITANLKGENSMSDMSLMVFTYEDLVREEKKRQAWAAVAAGLEGIGESMTAANAGYSNTTGTYSESAYSSTGDSAYGYGSYSSTTYDYAAAQEAQNAANFRSEARFDQLASEGRDNLQALSSRILKKHTVYPGDWHGGIVKIQMPRVSDIPNLFVVDINVDNEMHSFHFTQEKATK